jgi:F-type H+-transporting ATPase subunit gamma
MAQLIQMRRRIQTLETFKKIFNAMRLIAMSGHAKLKNKESSIKEYTETVEQLFYQIKALTPPEFDPLCKPGTNYNQRTLIIVVGSQKGLCGAFNESLFKLIDGSILSENNIDIIALGNKAINHIQKNHSHELIESFDKFSRANMQEIVWRLTQRILHQERPYKRVIIARNVLKTFFTQKPTVTHLLPIAASAKQGPIQESQFDDYIWEQPVEQLARDLVQLFIEAQLHQALFQSLIAEQSARFLSMDGATRNAEGLLEITALQYNKLRQTKITREITELVSSM